MHEQGVEKRREDRALYNVLAAEERRVMLDLRSGEDRRV
jgi:hypothetical protein